MASARRLEEVLEWTQKQITDAKKEATEQQDLVKKLVEQTVAV